MAPPFQYATPAEALRVLLAESKSAGIAFEEAWAEAMQLLRWPLTSSTRREWREALEETKHAWESAYVGDREAPEHRALRALVAA